jgi:hypothetical protein
VHNKQDVDVSIPRQNYMQQNIFFSDLSRSCHFGFPALTDLIVYSAAARPPSPWQLLEDGANGRD